MRFHQDAINAEIVGNVSDDVEVSFLTMTIVTLESQLFWSDQGYQSNEHSIIIDVKSATRDWVYYFEPDPYSTRYTIMVTAFDSSGRISDEFVVNPIIDSFNEEKRAEIGEKVPAFIDTNRTKVSQIEYAKENTNIAQLPSREKVVADTSTDLWPRRSELRVAVRVDDGANNPDRRSKNSIRALADAGVCSLADNADACAVKAQDWLLEIAKQWSFYGAITFVGTDSWLDANIRVSFEYECYLEFSGVYGSCGNWSTRGKINTQSIVEDTGFDNFQTMNIMNIDRGVVLHEFGHALGFAHEHLSPLSTVQWNDAAVIRHFEEINGWNANTTRSNVLEGISRATDPYLETVGSYDSDSIMHYPFAMFVGGEAKIEENRLVKNWADACDSTNPDYCFGGGSKLSAQDREGMKAIYPKNFDLQADVLAGNATFVVYPSSMTTEAVAVLYASVPRDYRTLAMDEKGKLHLDVRWSGTDTDRRCTGPFDLGFNCNTYATRDLFTMSWRYVANSNESTVLTSRTYAFNGDRNVGSGGSVGVSNGPQLCRSVACISNLVY